MEPLISVIVPVYKVEKYLDRCVESIVNQTYDNLEIILVDDGSPDNCPQMCAEWAKKDERIKVVHKKNGGLSSARNAGLEAFTGEYVFFIDSDDFVELNMIENIYNYIISNDYDICVCNNYHDDKNYNIIDSTKYNDLILLSNEEIICSFLDTTIFDSYSACNKCYKSSIIRMYNIRFDESNKWGEDLPFNYIYLKRCNKLISVSEAYYHYLIEREDSITDKISVGRVTRFLNYKFILSQESYNEKHNKIALKKYASEILVCCRELIRSNDKIIINKCYPIICSETQDMYYEFTRVKLSISNRFSLFLIKHFPKCFVFIYMIYYRCFRFVLK